jgi:hypothetical protein
LCFEAFSAASGKGFSVVLILLLEVNRFAKSKDFGRKEEAGC